MQLDLWLTLRTGRQAMPTGSLLELCSFSWLCFEGSLQRENGVSLEICRLFLGFTWEALYTNYLKMESAKQTQPASKCCGIFFLFLHKNGILV